MGRSHATQIPPVPGPYHVMRQFSRLEAGTHAAAQVDHLRLFRNRPDIRWQYRVHEQILLSIRRSGGSVK